MFGTEVTGSMYIFSLSLAACVQLKHYMVCLALIAVPVWCRRMRAVTHTCRHSSIAAPCTACVPACAACIPPGTQLTCFVPEEVLEPTSGLRPLLARQNPELDLLGPLTSTAAVAADAVSMTGSIGSNSAHAGAAAASSSSSTSLAAAAAAEKVGDGTSSAAAAIHPPVVLQAATASTGGFLQRGCCSGRGWHALAGLPTSRQLGDSGTAAAGGFGSAAAGSTRDQLESAAAAAAAAVGAVPVLGAPSAALALGGGQLGYTCIATVSSSSAFADRLGFCGSSSGAGGSSCVDDGSSAGFGSWGLLLAGTADGHVCCLDVETGTLVDDMQACLDPKPLLNPGYHYTPQQQLLMQQQQQHSQLNPLMLAAAGAPGVYGSLGWEDPSSCVVSAVCSSSGGRSIGGFRGLGGWLAAGSGSGRVMLLDSRAGLVIGSWQAHSQRVSQLQGLPGFRADWQLLSCSQDKTLKLWDLRMLRHTRYWSAAAGGGSGVLNPVAVYKGSKDGIEGFVVYQDAAIVYGGANLGLAPLDSSSSSSASQQQQQQDWSSPASAVTRQVRMTGIRGGGARGLGGGSSKASREGLGPKPTSSGSAIVGLGLLAHSKLLVVGSEDGQLKICR